MRKAFLLSLILILIPTFPFSAIAVDGHMGMEYDVEEHTGEGTLYLYEQFGELKIAGKFTAGLTEFGFVSEVVPTAEPDYQIYELIAEIKLSPKVTASISEELKYYFARNELEKYEDNKTTKIGVRYDF